MKRDDEIARRFLLAEGQDLKDRPEPKKRKWLKTRCPHCRKKVEYSPKKNFKGELRCGNCGKKFNITVLDHFNNY